MLTAILIYPFLHEAGHSIATILFGGKVVEFHLFPLPNVLCEVYSISNIGIVIIGISGMAFPLIVAMIIGKKTFAFWYISQVIIGISTYAFFISVVSLIMVRIGFQMPNEDVIKVIKIVPNSEIVLLVASIIFMIFSLWILVYNRPIKRMLEYLETKNPRIA